MNSRFEVYHHEIGDDKEVVKEVVVRGRGVSGKKPSINLGPGKRSREHASRHFIQGIAKTQ